MLETDVRPEVAAPEAEQGHWRCIWWAAPPLMAFGRDGKVAPRLGENEYVARDRYASEADADRGGRLNEDALRLEGFSADQLRYVRAEFFPDYPAA